MEKLSNIPALSRKQFLETMLVLINAELADAVCGVIDGIIVGHYLGEDAMAAHGIATPIFVLLSIFSYMITVGFQQPCTVYIGRGEPQKANGLFSATMFYTLVVAVLFSVTGLLFPRSFAHMMGAPSTGVIADMSTDYLKAVFMGTPFLLIFLSLIPVLQIDGERKLVHAGSVVMAVSDIIIDMLNVKVFHGGMWGIGMATTISYFLGMMVLLTYFLKKYRLFHLRPRDIAGSRPGQIFRMGLPAGARVAARSVAIISLNTLVMGTAGATAMAAFSVQVHAAAVGGYRHIRGNAPVERHQLWGAGPSRPHGPGAHERLFLYPYHGAVGRRGVLAGKAAGVLVPESAGRGLSTGGPCRPLAGCCHAPDGLVPLSGLL